MEQYAIRQKMLRIHYQPKSSLRSPQKYRNEINGDGSECTQQSSVKIEHIPNDCFVLVIADEAHHYPAPTWKLLVDHFHSSRWLLLTATPEHKGKPILSIPPCYELKRNVAVARGII